VSYLAGEPGYVDWVELRPVGVTARRVTFSYVTNTGNLTVPKSISAMDFTSTWGTRHWTYTQQVTTDGYVLLKSVQPPAGAAWLFDYLPGTDSTARYLLNKVTTPSGGTNKGTVSYTY